MHIWVDADACPKAAKDVLFKASTRSKIQLTLVANQPLTTPRLAHITAIQVSVGFDVADNEIIKRLHKGDLVITSDIPLAAEVLESGGHAISPRGELFTKDNIKARLAMRNLMDTLRATGIDTGGPDVFGASDKRAFANQLDRFLTKYTK